MIWKQFSENKTQFTITKYLFLIGFLLTQSLVGQYKIPDLPTKQTSVYDYVQLLSSAESNSLEQKLIRYSDSTSTQIVIAIISSTNNESIGILAPRWAHKWGVGDAKKDNGVFILLSRDDRQIWIAPGYGVEHLLTAGVTGELVRNIIIPEFKKGSYFNGLDVGVDAIFKVLNGTYKGNRKESNSKESSSSLFRIIPIIFFIILFIILSNRNKSGGKGGKRSGFSLLDAIILTNAGRGFGGGGSFGGGSSGGFGGGFGGGGFSGGGAGGSW